MRSQIETKDKLNVKKKFMMVHTNFSTIDSEEGWTKKDK